MAKQVRYSEEFKRQAVFAYLQGDFSCKQISQSLHIHPNTLSAWIKQFNDFSPSSQTPPQKSGHIKKYPPDNFELEAILSALADIETQLKILKRMITDYH